MSERAVPLVESVEVDHLFGRRSYRLDAPLQSLSGGRLVLLHGQNGSGKTTILRLIWHTLSPADARGHRTFLARTPFQRLLIRLADGSQIEVEKSRGLVGDFVLTVREQGEFLTAVDYAVDAELSVPTRSRRRTIGNSNAREYVLDDENVRIVYDDDGLPFVETAFDRAERIYLDFLQRQVRTPLFLADDRELHSDDPDLDRARERLQIEEDPRARNRPRNIQPTTTSEIKVAIQRVNQIIRGLTFGGQNLGSENANALYEAVLRQFVAAGEANDDSAEAMVVYDNLAVIAEASPGFSAYGLAPGFDAEEFRSLLDQVDTQSSAIGGLARRVIAPYLVSVSARYNALREAFDLIDSLVPSINRFLEGKTARFNPGYGLYIEAEGGDHLAVEQLSSGEKQLFMLLCTTFLARWDTRVFIIDEPELSLGVEWQRKLLDALLDITSGTDVQFWVATHSIEIVTSHPDSLVQLRGVGRID